MKKTVLFVNFCFLIILNSRAQDFTPGYYIINSSAEYFVAIPSSSDYIEMNDGSFIESPMEDLKMNAGEVVSVFEFSKGKYFCFDPYGRMIVIQGAGCLTKAISTPGAGVGYLKETITLIDGSELSQGSWFWVISQNIAASTYKIQVNDGLEYEVPSNKIDLFSTFIKSLLKDQIFVKVSE